MKDTVEGGCCRYSSSGRILVLSYQRLWEIVRDGQADLKETTDGIERK